MRSKWCRPDALITGADIRWYVAWRGQCSERWSLLDTVEWYGMVDGAIVYFFWSCPPGEYPRSMCAEFDKDRGLKIMLKAHERHRPAKVYCRGELPQELLAICGGWQ